MYPMYRNVVFGLESPIAGGGTICSSPIANYMPGLSLYVYPCGIKHPVYPVQSHIHHPENGKVSSLQVSFLSGLRMGKL